MLQENKGGDMGGGGRTGSPEKNPVTRKGRDGTGTQLVCMSCRHPTSREMGHSGARGRHDCGGRGTFRAQWANVFAIIPGTRHSLCPLCLYLGKPLIVSMAKAEDLKCQDCRLG